MIKKGICCCVLFLLLLHCFQLGRSQSVTIRHPHFPVRGYNHFQSWNVTSGSEGTFVYPSFDHNITTFDQYEFFVNQINFDTNTPGNFFIGAKNNLYEMNANLSVVRKFNWPVSPSSYATCASQSIDTSFACHNHIRVYTRLPQANAGNSRLWVCGTDAYFPVCKTLDINNIENTSEHSLTNVSTNDVGVLSVHPALPALWGFQSNEQILATGFYEANMWSDYDFARYNVSYNATSKHLEINHATADRTIQSSDDFHIREPYHPISMYDARLVTPEDSNSGMYLFFFREREFKAQESAAAPVRSRVIRICKDDTPTSSRFFGSLLKAEIFCAKQPLGTPEAFGAQTFYYTGLRDTHLGYNDSRWYGNRNVWDRLLYGVFTSEQYAPNGSALCVYYAGIKNFNDVSVFLDNNHRGVVEVFNQNYFLPKTGARVANSFLRCSAANARSQSDLLLAESGIQQYRGLYLPLLELPGEVVTKMVIDNACVVRFNDTTKCMMQDIVFVGTNVGKIYKIAFTTKVSDYPNINQLGLNGFSHDAIIAQEWQLADSRGVEQLYLRTENGKKYIYATTYSRIYKFAANNCDRNANCRDCVASRDPYCFWNMGSNKCEYHEFGSIDMADEVTITTGLLQNIHTGNHSSCLNGPPYCNVQVSRNYPIGFIVEHNCLSYSSIQLTAASHGCPNSNPISQAITSNRQVVNNAGILGLHLYFINVTVDYSTFEPISFTSYLTTVGGIPSVPTASEVFASGISNNNVQVVVTISGCSLHSVPSDHTIHVSFRGLDGMFRNFSQPYNGGNSFIAGPFASCENVTYFVTVTNSYGSSPVYTSSIQPYASPPNPPTSLRMTSVTSNSATITWNAPDAGENNNYCSNITGFSVYIDSVKKIDCVNSFEYTVMGLTSYTNYNFQVAACSEGGESVLASLTNRTECGNPTRVRLLTVNVVDHDELRFQWTNPSWSNGTLQYTLTEECFNQTTFTNDQYTFTSSDTTRTITSLQPRSFCCVTVVANATCDSLTYTSQPTIICAQTNDANPGPIENLNTMATGPNSILLTWLPSINYTLSGIMYDINVISPDGSTLMFDTARLYYHVTEGLANDTEYKFCIVARNDVDESSEVCRNGTTLPPPPEPPTDVSLMFDDNCNLTVTWEDLFSEKYSVDSYNVSVICNKNVMSKVVSASTKSATFTYCNHPEQVGLAWCGAQVFSENDIGPSALSQWANVVIPNTIGLTTPRCYRTEDIGHSVTFSYTLTSPFALDLLRVEYSLETVRVMPPVVQSGDSRFNATNTLTFYNLTRKTPYSFRVRICDDNIGDARSRCSQPCVHNFTSSSVNPDPPSIMKVTSGSSSVDLTWSPPANENPNNFIYTVQIAGTANNTRNTTDTSIKWESLRPDTDYTVAVLATDISSGVSSSYSEYIRIKTFSGNSTPGFIGAIYYPEDSRLNIFWNRPSIFNGTVLNYTIAWVPNNPDTSSCDSSTARLEIVGTDTNTIDVSLESSKITGVLICVAASTSAGRGPWNSTYITQEGGGFIIGGLSSGNNSNDRTALILVTVLATLAIVAAVAITIIFALICCMKYRKMSYNDTENSPSHKTNGDVPTRFSGMFKGKPKKQKAVRTPERDNTQSIRSTAPIMGND